MERESAYGKLATIACPSKKLSTKEILHRPVTIELLIIEVF